MANAVIGFPRWTNKITFSGGSYNASYPVGNLKELPLAKVARTTNLTLSNTQFIATLDKPRGVRLLSLVRHNLSLAARIRVTIYSDAAATIVIFDSGWFDVWSTVYLPEQLEWEDDNWWDGKYTQDEIAGYNSTLPIWLNSIYLARAIKVEIDDTSNAAGYVEVGLFEVALGWQTSVNFAYGASYGFKNRTTEIEADGGVKYFQRRDKPRVFRGSIDLLPKDEALAKAFEVQRQADIDVPFIWLPDPSETKHLIRNCFLARNVDPSLQTYTYFNRDSVILSLEEVL